MSSTQTVAVNPALLYDPPVCWQTVINTELISNRSLYIGQDPKKAFDIALVAQVILREYGIRSSVSVTKYTATEEIRLPDNFFGADLLLNS